MEPVACPHCGVGIVVDALNCGIFRCGVWRATGAQLDPHLPEEECRAAVGLIWGCGRPFQITVESGVFRVAACGYV